jgi:hypothetical protein
MVREYITLAAGCVSFGVILTFVMLGITARMGVDINKNFWIVALPAIASLTLNVALLELYRKFRKKRH